MASGDRSRQQNILDYETKNQQNRLDAANQQFQPAQQQMFGNYGPAASQSLSDYGDIMGRYKDYLGDPKNFGFERVSGTNVTAPTVGYSRSNELNSAMQGYQGFADTGGFDEAAQRDIRARGISPIRAAYANTQRNLDRAKALGGGGGASNYIAATSKAQRELPQQLADAEQGVNANLAQMIQQGRLAGLGGLSETSLADTQFGQQAKLANQDAQMRAMLSNQDVSLRAALANQGAGLQSGQNRLGALAGMTGLYSASPGLAGTFGNQALGAAGTNLDAQRLQQGISQGKISGQYNVAQMPTGFQSFLNNAGRIGQIAGNIASIPFGGGAGAITKGVGSTLSNLPNLRRPAGFQASQLPSSMGFPGRMY